MAEAPKDLVETGDRNDPKAAAAANPVQLGATPKNPWPPLVIVALGFFVALMDATIVNVAIPTMLPSLHATFDQILWVINAYLLVLAVLLITAGRVGDILGPRTLFVVGLGVFSLASVLCGLAQDANQLIAARVLQGFGAATMSPQVLVIVSSLFPPERRGQALGIVASVTALATIAGPTVGGSIVTYWDWRWVFFINVPIGIVGVVGGLTLVPNIRPGRRHRLDLVGVALATGGLLGIVFGLIEGQRYDWGMIGTSVVTIPEVMVAGGILLVLFVVWQRVPSEPLLPPVLFTKRNYSIATLLAGLSFFATFGFGLVFILECQSILGMSPIQAGLTFMPLSIVMAFTAPLAGRLTDRLGGRILLVGGSGLMAIGLGGLALLESLSATWLTFVVPLACYGLGMGCVTAPTLTVAINDVTPTLAGAASGLFNASRQVGGAIGAAVVGAVLQKQLVSNMQTGAGAAATQLPSSVRDQFIGAFANAGRSGLEVGRGQSGVTPVPAGLPGSDAHQILQLIHDVFVNAFVLSVRPALAVPAILMAVGAVCATLIVRRAAQVGVAPALPREPQRRVAIGLEQLRGRSVDHQQGDESHAND